MSTDNEFPDAVYALLGRLASSSESVPLSDLSPDEREAVPICKHHKLIEAAWAYPPGTNPSTVLPWPPHPGFPVIFVAPAGRSALAEYRLRGNRPRVTYLGISLGEREAWREVDTSKLGPAKFEKKDLPWKLFTMLVQAGPDGLACGKVKIAIGNSLYNHKGTLENLLRPLKLIVKTGGGTWTLVHL